MTPKNISIDELARMVQDGFAEARKHTDEQFTQIRQEIAEFRSEVSQDSTQVHQELRSIRKELEGAVLRSEFEALQDKVRDMDHLLTTLRKKAA